MSIVSCLEAVFSRIGGLTAAFVRKGGELVCSVSGKHCTFGFDRIDTDFKASVTKKSGMRATFGIVCTAGLDDYILWASDDMVLNVYGDKIYLTRKNNG